MGKHRQPVTRRQRLTAMIVGLVVFVAVAIAEERASRIPSQVKDLVIDSATTTFPGELDVTYGSFQATTALFVNGLPDNLPAEAEIDRTPWALKNGGALAWRSTVNISFRGKEAEPVYIDDVRLSQHECAGPPSGLFMLPSGAGDTADRWLELNLDLDDPNAHRILSSDTSDDGLWQFPIWVSDVEQEVLSVYLRTWDRDCTFALDIVYRTGDDSRRLRLTEDDHGRIFRLVGPSNAHSILRMRDGEGADYTITEQPPNRSELGG